LVTRVRVKRDRTSVAYPPVDYGFWDAARHSPRQLRPELGLKESDPLYLYFGRPGVSKGLEYLLEAAVRVSCERPSSRLLMLLSRSPIGQHQRVQRLINRLGLRDHVIVKDPVPRVELPGYLMAADCVAVPSLSEGFGYAAVEAAALGCRVIATSGHSVQEVVGDAVTLVPPRDPQSLAVAIRDAITNRPPVGPPPPAAYTLDAHVAAIERLYSPVHSGRNAIR
jgi:glycosyltransferase involved in cell wall biosynthesis